MKGVFGNPDTSESQKSAAPVKCYSVWCHRCGKMAGRLDGGKFTRVECDCAGLDKAHIREKMGLPPGAEIPPWGDPLWMRVFGISAYQHRGGPVSFGQAVAEVFDDLAVAVRTEPPVAAEPEPEAAIQPDPAAETPVAAPSGEVPPEADPDFPDPEDGLGETAEPGQAEAVPGASPEGLE